MNLHIARRSKRSTPETVPNWFKPAGIPAGADRVPPGEGFPLAKILAINFGVLKDFTGLRVAETLHYLSFGYKRFQEGKFILKSRPDLGLVDIFADAGRWDSFESFEEFFKPWTMMRKPDVAQRWMDDAEFGRQRLVGINPAHIRRCSPEALKAFLYDAQPESIAVSEARALDDACKRGRLYTLDFRILENIIDSQVQNELGRYPLAPVGLFLHSPDGELLPAAIRLSYAKGPAPARIFSPSSSAGDWLIAKIALSSADTAYQGVVTHLLFTHLVMDIFALATERALPQNHLLRELLEPHFYNTFAINDLARALFLGRGRFFDSTGALAYGGSIELLTRAYTGSGRDYQGEPWRFYERALPRDLQERDVADLSGYDYRDDALLHWAAIEEYVGSVLSIAYATPAAIANDGHLQAWLEQLTAPQYGDVKGLLPPDRPDPRQLGLRSIDDLIDIVTNIIFTATAQHSAVNFGQRDYYTWIPNAQFATYQPFDDVLSGDGTQRFTPLQRLPNRKQTIRQMVLSRALSIEPPLTSASLLTMKPAFSNPVAQQAFGRFRKRMRDIEDEIVSRNRTRARPYLYLLPSKVPQSVAI